MRMQIRLSCIKSQAWLFRYLNQSPSPYRLYFYYLFTFRNGNYLVSANKIEMENRKPAYKPDGYEAVYYDNN